LRWVLDEESEKLDEKLDEKLGSGAGALTVGSICRISVVDTSLSNHKGRNLLIDDKGTKSSDEACGTVLFGCYLS